MMSKSIASHNPEGRANRSRIGGKGESVFKSSQTLLLEATEKGEGASQGNISMSGNFLDGCELNSGVLSHFY